MQMESVLVSNLKLSTSGQKISFAILKRPLSRGAHLDYDLKSQL